jgi:peptide chain release factor subunit 1
MPHGARLKLKKLLTELAKIKGRHTELVSVYIPAGFAITDIAAMIRAERGTAENIKSKTTRKNVTDALTKIEQHLKLYKVTPPNGLAIFCGNIAAEPGVSDIRLWAIEPPELLRVKLYWCDQTFELGPLKDMVRERELYGLVVMDNKEATIGLLRGKAIQLLRHLESLVPSKTAKGGWSAQRFARVRAGLIHDFYKEIAEEIKASMPKEIKGILLGGPGPAKEDFYRRDYLPSDIKAKVLGVRAVSYADETGLAELLERSAQLLASAAVIREKELCKRFLGHLQRADGLVTYGLKPVLRALKAGAVEILLLSEETDLIDVELRCACEFASKRILRMAEAEKQICPGCGQKMAVIGKRAAAEALAEAATAAGAVLEIISRETKEGVQIAALGGIAAILRWKFAS